MGRELKRKEAKRSGKNVKEVQKKSNDTGITTKNFIVIMIIITTLLLLVYILTGIFATKDIKWFSDKDNKEEEKETVIANRILAVDSLNQKDEEYYVYFYDTSKEDTLVSSKIGTLMFMVYRVDLHDDFNSSFVGEPSGIVENIGDLKVTNPTLIKVSSGKIVSFYSGSEEINNISE